MGATSASEERPPFLVYKEQLQREEGAEDGQVNLLTGAHKRTAYALTFEIERLGREYGIERLGFLTLTFADAVIEKREAMKRFRSLVNGVLNDRYERWIRVAERQKSGRWHFHLVVVVPEDIRTGIDFAAIADGVYRSANDALREEWAFWRVTASKYGFGRTELLPVKSTAEGIARYVGKYVSKHIEERRDEDKGMRVVAFGNYGKGERRCSSRFAWNTPNARLWRGKLAVFAETIGADTVEDLKALYGSSWAYHVAPSVFAISDFAVSLFELGYTEKEFARIELASGEGQVEARAGEGDGEDKDKRADCPAGLSAGRSERVDLDKPPVVEGTGRRYRMDAPGAERVFKRRPNFDGVLDDFAPLVSESPPGLNALEPW